MADLSWSWGTPHQYVIPIELTGLSRMKKRYVWRRSWNSIKRHRNKVVLVGAACTGIAVAGFLAIFLILASTRLPAPLPDLRDLRNLVLIGLFGIGALIYWVIVGVVFWRWWKAQRRHNRVSMQALNTARLIQPEKPNVSASALARKGGRVPAASLSPAEFEREVAWVFSKRFGLQAEVVGKANDGGIDVKLYDASNTLVAIIQAKRYDEKKALNPSFLRELDSCKRRMGVPHAYLVTTAHFSADVRQQAQEMHIDLVDGRLFEEWRQNVHALPNGGNQPGVQAPRNPKW